MKKISRRSNGKKLQTVGKNATKIEKKPECNRGSRVGKAAKEEPMKEGDGKSCYSKK